VVSAMHNEGEGARLSTTLIRPLLKSAVKCVPQPLPCMKEGEGGG